MQQGLEHETVGIWLKLSPIGKRRSNSKNKLVKLLKESKKLKRNENPYILLNFRGNVSRVDPYSAICKFYESLSFLTLEEYKLYSQSCRKYRNVIDFSSVMNGNMLLNVKSDKIKKIWTVKMKKYLLRERRFIFLCTGNVYFKNC